MTQGVFSTCIILSPPVSSTDPPCDPPQISQTRTNPWAYSGTIFSCLCHSWSLYLAILPPSSAQPGTLLCIQLIHVLLFFCSDVICYPRQGIVWTVLRGGDTVGPNSTTSATQQKTRYHWVGTQPKWPPKAGQLMIIGLNLVEPHCCDLSSSPALLYCPVCSTACLTIAINQWYNIAMDN
jgi:hypothetical protein